MAPGGLGREPDRQASDLEQVMASGPRGTSFVQLGRPLPGAAKGLAGGLEGEPGPLPPTLVCPPALREHPRAARTSRHLLSRGQAVLCPARGLRSGRAGASGPRAARYGCQHRTPPPGGPRPPRPALCHLRHGPQLDFPVKVAALATASPPLGAPRGPLCCPPPPNFDTLSKVWLAPAMGGPVAEPALCLSGPVG